MVYLSRSFESKRSHRLYFHLSNVLPPNQDGSEPSPMGTPALGSFRSAHQNRWCVSKIAYFPKRCKKDTVYLCHSNTVKMCILHENAARGYGFTSACVLDLLWSKSHLTVAYVEITILPKTCFSNYDAHSDFFLCSFQVPSDIACPNFMVACCPARPIVNYKLVVLCVQKVFSPGNFYLFLACPLTLSSFFSSLRIIDDKREV
jgi:hypothetical protein